MKQAISILIGYLTCDDPTVVTKWANLLASYWHKDEGKIVSSISTATNGDVSIEIKDGDGNTETTTIPKTHLPTSYDISFINGLQDALNTKVDKVPGKGLSTNDFTTALKQKLESLTNYVHPNTHSISEIEGLQAALAGIPTKTSELQNDGEGSNPFITQAEVEGVGEIEVKDHLDNTQFAGSTLSFGEYFEIDAVTKRVKLPVRFGVNGYSTFGGFRALENSTGDRQTAFGTVALVNSTGSHSTAFGDNALATNSGPNSSGLGYLVLGDNSGPNSSGLGHSAGRNNSGADSVFLGYYAGYFSGIANVFDNVTVLGASAAATKANQVSLGDTNVVEVLLAAKLAVDINAIHGAADNTPLKVTTVSGIKTITV